MKKTDKMIRLDNALRRFLVEGEAIDAIDVDDAVKKYLAKKEKKENNKPIEVTTK